MSALVWGGVGWESLRGEEGKTLLWEWVGRTPAPPLQSVGTRRAPGRPQDWRVKASALAGSSAVMQAQQRWLGKLVFMAKNESSPPSASRRPTVCRALDLERGGCLHEHGGLCL